MDEAELALLDELMAKLVVLPLPDKDLVGVGSAETALGAGLEARRAAAAGVVELLQTSGKLRNWSVSLHNHFRNRLAPAYVDREDVEAEISAILMKLLVYVTEATRPNNSWVFFLYGAAKNRIANWTLSGAVTGRTEFSGIAKRQNLINIAERDLVATLGRQPTAQEIIEHNNVAAIGRSKSERTASKAGVLLNEADFEHRQAAKAAVPILLGENDDDIGQVIISDDSRPEAGLLRAESGMLRAALTNAAAWRVALACVETWPTECGLLTVARAIVRQRSLGEDETPTAIAASGAASLKLAGSHYRTLVGDDDFLILVTTLLDEPVYQAERMLIRWCLERHRTDLGLVSVAREWMYRTGVNDPISAKAIAAALRMPSVRVSSHLHQLEDVLGRIRGTRTESFDEDVAPVA